MGTQLLLPQRGTDPLQFSAHICCNQMAAWIKMSLDMEQGFGPGDFVLDVDPALPSPKGGGAPKFSAHVYCGQTAAWIRMPRGMQIGLSPSDIVLDGDPTPPTQRGTAALPNFFRPMAKRLRYFSEFGYSFRAHCVNVHVRYLIS